jgi:hypothetical protein
MIHTDRTGNDQQNTTQLIATMRCDGDIQTTPSLFALVHDGVIIHVGYSV